MKRNNYFILFVLLFGFTTTSIKAQHIDAGPDQTVCNGETEVSLHADIGRVLTGRYRVESTPFNWIPIDATAQDVMITDGGTTGPLRIDDRYGNAIDLPFPVYFYGRTYNQIVVGSNGDIIFEPSVATTYDAWPIDPTELIPNHTLPYWDSGSNLSFASIMGAYHDIDISVTYPTEELKYMTVGTAPNRKFVIIYKDIPQFSCNNLLSSQEIIFNESDFSFEVHIKEKPVCSGWNDGLATLGTQNEELLPDTCGNYPGDITSSTLPNRNTGAWDISPATPEAYKFIPDANATIKWYDSSRNVVGTGADVTVPFNPVNGQETYTLEVVFEDCHGNTFSEFDEVTVYQLPQPQVNLPEEEMICQNETKILDGTVQNTSDYTNISYEWVDGAGTVLGTDPKLTISNGGTYTVNITVDGCVASFTDVVTPYQFECRVPEAISPNGDGDNDQWFLDYLAQKTGIDKVEIFDRRGVLVYEKSDYTHEFVGKNNNGEDLPAATYVYVIKLKDGKKLTGWLYLAR